MFSAVHCWLFVARLLSAVDFARTPAFHTYDFMPTIPLEFPPYKKLAQENIYFLLPSNWVYDLPPPSAIHVMTKWNNEAQS